MKRYAIYVCGDTDCPTDDTFEHRFYFGCVPKDFKERTGRSKTHQQSKVQTPEGPRYRWNGGCDDLKVGAPESEQREQPQALDSASAESERA